MPKTIILIILTLFSFHTFGQNADALNERSKKLLEEQKYEEAVELLEKAAKLGNAESQYNLGYCYQEGYGVEHSAEKAIEWYLKSADQGFNDALYQMMMAYGNGIGVEQNPEKAFLYALACAENNDGTCMFNVASCYKEGRGTKKDLDKMLEWAIRLGKLENPNNLAKSGYITSARLNLAYMYREGLDINKDLFKSYQWFLIYNESKKDFSVFQQEYIIKDIQELETKLTTEEKEKGLATAEDLLGRSLKNINNLYKVEY